MMSWFGVQSGFLSTRLSLGETDGGDMASDEMREAVVLARANTSDWLFPSGANSVTMVT